MSDNECGHVNFHAYGLDGKLVNLACTKEKNHNGNHGANHHIKSSKFSSSLAMEGLAHSTEPTGLFLKDGRPEMVDVYEGDVWTEWNDAAGVPASEIVPSSPGIELIDSEIHGKEQQRK